MSRLVQVYANRGHLLADIDPLGLMQRPVPEELELGHFGLSEADLDTEFYTGSRTDAIARRMKLRDMVAQLRHIYCGTIGAEFAHVSDSRERLWLQDRFQEGRVQQRFSAEERRTFLRHLTAAEGLKRYLATRYPAQKRFSLEGGDALIPLLDDLIQQGGMRGIEEIVIGMAHRGRLNVLVNELSSVAPRNGLFRANCLHQSMALCRLLRRHGLQAILRVGVLPRSRPLQAHAWVELDGVALGQPSVEEYEVFERLTAKAENMRFI